MKLPLLYAITTPLILLGASCGTVTTNPLDLRPTYYQWVSRCQLEGGAPPPTGPKDVNDTATMAKAKYTAVYAVTHLQPQNCAEALADPNALLLCADGAQNYTLKEGGDPNKAADWIPNPNAPYRICQPGVISPALLGDGLHDFSGSGPTWTQKGGQSQIVASKVPSPVGYAGINGQNAAEALLQISRITGVYATK